MNLLSLDLCDEYCNCISYIALFGILTVIHKLEKMFTEVVTYLKVFFHNFLGKTEEKS